jgi:rhamnulose-1-phosphate aldolase
MMMSAPKINLGEILNKMGEAGKRLDEIGSNEGASGNISVCLRGALNLIPTFPIAQDFQLPYPVPELSCATILVSGSGTRLREMTEEPTANIACIVIKPGGSTGIIYKSPHSQFERITSEFNSHLAVHQKQMASPDNDFNAVIHAQPFYLTFLSHITRYQNYTNLNTHLLRWQPETILQFSEGLGLIPFEIPGSPELMTSTVDKLKQHRLVIWAKHGVMARSDKSVKEVVDLIEYAEAAARYEYLNLTVGEVGEGLTSAEIRSICGSAGIKQNIF